MKPMPFEKISPAAASLAVLCALACVALGIAAFALLRGEARGVPVRKPARGSPVAYAGLRASTYGIVPFPEIAEWDSYARSMEEAFPGSVGSFVWIVGNVNGNAGRQSCTLNFPLERPIPLASGFPVDGNEAFLELCDRRGYSVWLQVEPGDSDPVALCRAVLERYRGHPSVRGFGLDVEWYGTAGTDGWGTAIGDGLARRLVKAARSVDRRYEVFLKHWDADWMPPTEREGIVFVNDSQGHESLDSMKAEFAAWSRRFAPSPVAFQIGYGADRRIWGAMADPVSELGLALAEGAAPGQEVSVVWVDFTLRPVMAARSAGGREGTAETETSRSTPGPDSGTLVSR